MKTSRRTILLVGLACAIAMGCATTPAQLRARGIRERLDSITIPEVDFRMANPFCSLKFLEAEAQEIDPTHQGVSIVYMPAGTNHPEVTYAARNISLREALNLFCEIGGLQWSIEDSVIKVKPRKVQQVSAP